MIGSTAAERGLHVVGATVTPIAVVDPPLLNSVGVHQPYALRAVVQVHTDAGITGLAEAYGDDPTLDRLRRVIPALTGLDVFDIHGLTRRVSVALAGVEADTPTELIGVASVAKAVAATVAAFEVALFDIQGKATGPPGVRSTRRGRTAGRTVQRLPVLQVGRASGRRRRTSSEPRSTRPGSSRRPAASSRRTVSAR